MTKVVIDSFDTEEQAIAFVDWLKKQCDNGKVTMLTTQSYKSVDYDGIDHSMTNHIQITVNITTSDIYEDEGF